MLSTCLHSDQPLVFLLWRYVYVGLLPIFQLGYLGFFVIFVVVELYELVKLSPWFQHLQIFFHSIDCLFVLFMVSSKGL